LKKEFMESSPYQRAYERWFSRYEVERRRQKKRRGASIADFPAPPTNPCDISAALDRVGRLRFLRILEAHRSTLARWEAGSSVMPRAAWLLLILLDQGRLPGMSDDWLDFRFDGDRLVLIGTRIAYTAREIAGWQYQQAHTAALSRRVAELERRISYLINQDRSEAANAAFFTA
jgi:hypothetical protein